MKKSLVDIRITKVHGQYYLCGSRYFVAEPDAVRGAYLSDGFIIANDYNDAQELLTIELKKEIKYT